MNIGADTVYPMDITMSRVCLGSDTCDLYFSYIKVNHLLYTCSLDPFEDGILLDTPLVCMHRYCRSFTDGEEECKRQGSPTPSAREASLDKAITRESQTHDVDVCGAGKAYNMVAKRVSNNQFRDAKVNKRSTTVLCWS